MVPLCQYEAKKGMDSSRRHAKAESEAGSPPKKKKKENYVRLVGLGRYATLGNAQTKRYSQQTSLHCLAVSCKRDYSPEKIRFTKPSHLTPL